MEQRIWLLACCVAALVLAGDPTADNAPTAFEIIARRDFVHATSLRTNVALTAEEALKRMQILARRPQAHFDARAKEGNLRAIASGKIPTATRVAALKQLNKQPREENALVEKLAYRLLLAEVAELSKAEQVRWAKWRADRPAAEFERRAREAYTWVAALGKRGPRIAELKRAVALSGQELRKLVRARFEHDVGKQDVDTMYRLSREEAKQYQHGSTWAGKATTVGGLLDKNGEIRVTQTEIAALRELYRTIHTNDEKDRSRAVTEIKRIFGERAKTMGLLLYDKDGYALYVWPRPPGKQARATDAPYKLSAREAAGYGSNARLAGKIPVGGDLLNVKLDRSEFDEWFAIAKTIDIGRAEDRARAVREFKRIFGDRAKGLEIVFYDKAGRPRYVWPKPKG